MKRSLILVLALFVAAAATLAAQSPSGWKLRVDRSSSATDPDAAGAIKFTSEGTAFHAINPQAAVYWHPGNAATGNYSLKSTFTLVEPSNHTNYYGIVFGGHDLEGPKQSYMYFTVAQDGTWLIKRRDGDVNTQDIAPKTASPAIKKPAAGGTSTNVLEVRVAADKVDYLVNGTTVHSTPKSALPASTDGTYGVRVNHFLNVKFEPVTLTKQ
jgi:uncharacterized iron-regulated membrane protein